MANLSEDIQCAGKDNGVNILKSINEGPFQMGTFRETLAEGHEGALHLGPERPRVYSDLSPEEKERGTMHGVQVQLVMGELKTKSGMQIQVKQSRLCATTAMDLALNMDNVFQADDCDAFDFDVDEAPTVQIMFMANLSFVYPVYDEAGPSYDSDILSEVHDHDHYPDVVCEHHEVQEMHDDVQPNYVVDSHADYMSDSNMFYMIKLEAEIDQHVVNKKHAEIERKNLLIENDNLIVDCLSKDVFYTATDSVLTCSRFSDMHEAFNAAQKRIAKLESENSNLQNKIQTNDHDRQYDSRVERENLSIDKEDSDADPIHDLKALDSHNKELHAKVNALHDLNERWREENEKVKRHYKEFDVEPIPPRNWNNREVHLDYLKHLKESVTTLHEIAEEARVEKPLDSSLAYACLNTKHSQELVEYVIGTCPKDFNKGDKQIASTPVTRTKRVTFIDPCATAASGSNPRRNTKKDRTLPAQSDMKKVEVHPRNNKSSVKRKNHVDYSISYKRTVINSNTNSVCKTCNKCLMSDNYDKCVVKSVKSVKQPPVKKVWQIELVKQVWQATGKLFATVVQIVLSYLDSGCSKHMTGDRSRLKNFVKKFSKTVRFGNEHFGAIIGYEDYVIGDKVAFRKHSCYVRDTNGVELIKGSRGSNCSEDTTTEWRCRKTNHTLVEAARTMLIFSKALMFLWAEAIATARYTQNRSLIHTRRNKTPYELVHDKKLDLTFL
nr:putative ribonuclease H-like domain-containing protein [Tanacetum cinerariifolium]